MLFDFAQFLYRIYLLGLTLLPKRALHNGNSFKSHEKIVTDGLPKQPPTSSFEMKLLCDGYRELMVFSVMWFRHCMVWYGIEWHGIQYCSYIPILCTQTAFYGIFFSLVHTIFKNVSIHIFNTCTRMRWYDNTT